MADDKTKGDKRDTIQVAADEVVACDQREPTSPQGEPVCRPGGQRHFVAQHGCFQRVTDTVHGADQRRGAITVAERCPQLLDQRGQRRIGHQSTGPEPLVQLALGHHPGCAIEQRDQQIERAGRQVDFSAAELHPTRLRVELEP